MRAVHGKLLIKGLPRMTRPRVRKNIGHLGGFSVVDLGGNWIRIIPLDAAPARAATTKLGKAMENAVVLADSHGEVGQALKILEGALTRERATASAEDLVQAEAYRDELRERAS
jgi:hypothetical protein